MISEQDILNARILIADDRQANVTFLEEVLREEGFLHVTSTVDPTAVTGLHQANNFDLILLDIEMPGVDGFAVMKTLREIDCHGYAPVLVISAHAEHKLQALQSGAKDFISKPLDITEVRARIHNMLEVRLLYMQLEDGNRKLELMALHDGLTGLPNRRLLFDRLSSDISRAKRNESMMAVLYLDLDLFKEINDSFGHDIGDEMLSEMGRRLAAAVRQEDTVARLGGDEFILVLPELKEIKDIEIYVPKLITAVARPCSIGGADINITASIGVSIYPMHGDTPELLIKRADMALYRSKHLGKNQYCIASDHDSRQYVT